MFVQTSTKKTYFGSKKGYLFIILNKTGIVIGKVCFLAYICSIAMKFIKVHILFILLFTAFQLYADPPKRVIEQPSVKHKSPAHICIEDIPHLSDITITPNPTSVETKLEFTSLKVAKVEISLLNTIGKKYDHLTVNKEFGIGRHVVTIKTSDLPQGLYFIEIISNGSRTIQRLFVIAP